MPFLTQNDMVLIKKYEILDNRIKEFVWCDDNKGCLFIRVPMSPVYAGLQIEDFFHINYPKLGKEYWFIYSDKNQELMLRINKAVLLKHHSDLFVKEDCTAKHSNCPDCKRALKIKKTSEEKEEERKQRKLDKDWDR